MKILNISAYKFINLVELNLLAVTLQKLCDNLKGTILLSPEGINVNLAGTIEHVKPILLFFKNDDRFADMGFKISYSNTYPFQRLKIKIKNEIIAFRTPNINPGQQQAMRVTPSRFKEWLDKKQDMLILDTRNKYEVSLGTFAGAINLELNHFCEFPEASKKIAVKDKPIVMFCTGGVRCEKAALYMMQQGYLQVFQLEGGILNYFEKIGNAHYQGACFVFDDRITIGAADVR